MDEASATDLRERTQWRALLDAASKRKVDLVLVWKLDRAFRSVLDANSTLQKLKRWGVGLRSYTEPMIDTASGSPWGEMLFNLLATFAQFERGLISERTRAGMARAKAQGKHAGRPRKGVVQTKPRNALENKALLPADGALANGTLSRAAAKGAANAALGEAVTADQRRARLEL